MTIIEQEQGFRGFSRISRRDFLSVCMKYFLLARSYRVLSVDMKSLIIIGLVTLETMLKVPTLIIF